jgi:hemolysin D
MKIQLLALQDLGQRYLRVFRAAWEIRAQLEGPTLEAHERAFLPAHLELAETPVHPAPLWTLRLLVAFTLCTLLWALLGHLDIVASCKGKLIPSDKVKVVQPMDTGVVSSIQVQDGMRVKQGQILLELDPTQAQADALKANDSRQDAALAVARAQALLSAMNTQHEPQVALIPGLPTARQQEAQDFAVGLYDEYREKIAAGQDELFKRQNELQTARDEISKLRQTAPLARQVADSYQTLVQENDVSRQDYLEKQQTSIEQQQELIAQQSHAHELEAGIAEQQRDIDATSAQFRREQLDALNQAQQQLAQNQQNETKASQRQQRTILRAPVDGTVQQLAVHTVGGVVTLAQALMEIVPDDTLEVEAQVENKDIGFVYPGQTVAVKIETFPYTRYGTINGTVITVSNDAVQDKKLGLIFPARIRLSTNRIRIENKWVNLAPGMEVTADINTGKRTVAEYFLSPLVDYSKVSLRER